MADPFQTYQPGLDAPASSAFAITPNDSTDLATSTRAIYVGTAGDLKATFINDTNPVTLKNVAVGEHPYRLKRVYATLTTAADLVGLD